jgi:hypothetical protein
LVAECFPFRNEILHRFIIRRPVLATVVSLIILIAGLQAIRSLNLRQYPRSENATVTVTTVYVGASADLVRGFVTQPLERAIAAADGIEYMESSSALGLSTITASAAELRFQKGAGRNQLQGGPGAQRPAAGGGNSHAHHRHRRFAVCLGLPEFFVGHFGGEPDHGLSRAHRAAAL